MNKDIENMKFLLVFAFFIVFLLIFSFLFLFFVLFSFILAFIVFLGEKCNFRQKMALFWKKIILFLANVIWKITHNYRAARAIAGNFEKIDVIWDHPHGRPHPPPQHYLIKII